MPKTTLPRTDSVTHHPRSAKIRQIHPSIPFTIAILILLYLGVNIWIYFYGTALFTFSPFLKKSIETASVIKKQGFGTIPGPTSKTPQPVFTLPAGKHEWVLERQPDAPGPRVKTAGVDPLTPKKGGAQTVTITAKNDAPISAKATLFTDTKQKSADMKRVSGSDTDGTWSVTWSVDDTYDRIYHIDFELTSTNGNWKGALTFR